MLFGVLFLPELAPKHVRKPALIAFHGEERFAFRGLIAAQQCFRVLPVAGCSDVVERVVLCLKRIWGPDVDPVLRRTVDRGKRLLTWVPFACRSESGIRGLAASAQASDGQIPPFESERVQLNQDGSDLQRRRASPRGLSRISRDRPTRRSQSSCARTLSNIEMTPGARAVP